MLFGEPCEQDFAASAAVALHCGFSSEVYFIRRFRELYGRSPGRYRLERKN
ncbi:AraC family transcriptional regulator [uncultured Victivallis sp.]|uniref:AraC family transcriptional regulator n=1 Tax=uncultured Victivallis sp. TaxID=354118 RepID=UPI00345E0153